jgi:hypothetical protein
VTVLNNLADDIDAGADTGPGQHVLSDWRRSQRS